MDRTARGQEIYIESMEKSAMDKLRIFSFIKEGIIVDMGAGAGAISALLLRHFPESKTVAVDNSPDMIRRLKKRFDNNSQVEIIKDGLTSFRYKSKVDTILFISVLHELFSFNNYSHKLVIDTLRNTFNLLNKGGRLIIRDGVQPEQTTLYLKPLHKDSYNRFHEFIRSFKVRPLVFSQGIFSQDSFIQQTPNNYEEFKKDNYLIEMQAQDVSELLSKYFYSEVNLPIELKEQFGIWTLEEYKEVLKGLGFSILHAETFILDYLLKEHYSKDYEIFHLVNGVLSNAPYPPSTMLLVGEK